MILCDICLIPSKKHLNQLLRILLDLFIHTRMFRYDQDYDQLIGLSNLTISLESITERDIIQSFQEINR